MAQNGISECMSFTALGSGGHYKVSLTESLTPFKNTESELKGCGLTQGGSFVNRVAVTRGSHPSHDILQPWIGVYFWRRTA